MIDNEIKIMFLVDSHCHLDSLDYQQLHRDVNDVIDKAKQQDVRFILAVSTTLPACQRMLAQMGQQPSLAFSCGVHPLELDDNSTFAQLAQLAADKRIVALGETGLDYYYQQDNRQQQQAWFAQHIRVGRQLQKPVIIHTRSAQQDTLALLRAEKISECGAVLHCFTEDLSMAKQLLDLGLYISFSGIVTFKNAQALKEVARYVPLDRLLVETDSPYLAPIPYRGKQNQPAYVRQVAQYLADLKNIPLPQLAHTTTENFCKLFKLEKFVN